MHNLGVTVSGKKIKHGCKLWPVDVSACKSELYGLLGKDRPAEGDPYPAGWVHFASDLDEEFFRQLTAESLQTHVVKGYRKTEWIKTRERNEALDCSNYARAAASVVGMDRRGSDDRWWSRLEAHLGVVSYVPSVKAAPSEVSNEMRSVAPPSQARIMPSEVVQRPSSLRSIYRTSRSRYL